MKLPKLSTKWGVACLVIVVALILHQMPQSMEVTLEVRTDHFDFKLPGNEMEIDILGGLPLTALHVSHVMSLSLPVNAVNESGQALVSSAQRVTFRSQGEQALRLTFRGEALRLLQLSLASDAQVVLSTDRQSQLIMQVDNPGLSLLRLGVLQAFTLTGHNLIVVDEQGNEFRPTVVQNARSLEVTPEFHNVDIEWQQAAFTLTLDVSGQRVGQADWPLPFEPLPMHHLNFTRKAGTTLVSSIQSLGVYPLMKKEDKESVVFLDLRTDDVFRLRSMKLSGTVLTCELIGRTNQLRYGPGASRPNRMPSWLQYWVQNGFIKVIREIVEIFK